jgi:hypothetical protein
MKTSGTKKRERKARHLRKLELPEEEEESPDSDGEHELTLS